MSRTVLDAYANQGVILVERAASFIDGDKFEALVKSLDVNDPFYEEIRLQMFNLKEFSGALYLYTIAPKEGNIWMYIIDGSAEPDCEENFSALGELEDVSHHDDAFRRAWVTGETEISGLVDQGEWGWLISVYTPIKNSRGTIVGLVSCDYDGQDLHDSIIAIEVMLMLIGAAAAAIGLVFLLFIMRMIFNPIKEVKFILDEISHGGGDLTKRILGVKQNEIGELANSFNATLDMIANLIMNIKNNTGMLSETGNELSANMTQTAAAVNQITANIKSIKGRMLNQSTSVNETNATMEQIVGNINKLSGQVEDQTTHVSNVSSAIEEMVANIQSVTGTLDKNVGNVRTLRKASEAGYIGLQEVSGNIQEIAKESEGLLAINSVMENIASQTNLLSMNAAIEAAHAGEAGKGFAVVAGEIRKLAEGSSKQSKTISVVLKKIKGSIDKITRSTGNVMEKFKDIDTNVRIVTEQEETIKSAMEEQEEGSKQVLEGIGSVNEITKRVHSGSQEMLVGSKEVIREGANLEQSTQEVTGGINEMASGADQINVAVFRVSEICVQNQKNIENLVKEVSRFKVE